MFPAIDRRRPAPRQRHVLWLALFGLLSSCQNSPVLDTSGAEDLDGDGQTLLDGDCNDRNPAIFAGSAETCDGLDNDCDTLIDEDVAQAYYQDTDIDGFGAGPQLSGGCSIGLGQSGNTLDCDDGRGDVYPNAPETCDGVDNDCDGTTDTDTPDDLKSIYYQDLDQDGFGDIDEPVYDCALSPPAGAVARAGDCDDRSAGTRPGAPEQCDGFDNDCDGQTDEDFADTNGVVRCEFCNGIDDDGLNGVDDGFDRDNDGYTSAVDCLECLDNFDTCGQDCDDENPEVNPSVAEVCDADDVDEDCDELSDDDDPNVVKDDADVWYLDRDQDGYGVTGGTSTYRFCDPPAGYAEVPGDCNDSKASVNPSAEEKIDDGVDQNCDGYEVCYKDFDADGYRPNATDTLFSSTLDCTGERAATAKDPTGDCDDTDPIINPLAEERCNQADDDCDGKVDEDALDESITELCNTRDDDCDGVVDDEAGELWYKDGDADGYGDKTASRQSCTQPTGYVGNDDDCDDSARTTYPGATERCNSVDDDCDGDQDESASDTPTWYQDLDKDGYGDSKKSQASCTRPDGFVSNDFDCDDSNASISPVGIESCNTQDDDCDGKIDDGVTNACGKCGTVPSEVCNSQDDDCDGVIDDGVGETWYRDGDADGYGESSSTRFACTAPDGYIATSGDCDDGDPQVNPAAAETCNLIDDDCDGKVDDDATDTDTYYRDSDGDGYGTSTSSTKACTKPTGYSSSSTDCDDITKTTYPGAVETCNSRDDDCDGQTDENTTTTYYRDQDGDGYGSTTTTQACTRPTGYTTTSGDCNDTNAAINPAATESCGNSLDDNCNGVADEDSVCKCTYSLYFYSLYIDQDEGDNDPAEMQVRLTINSNQVRLPSSDGWYHLYDGGTWTANYFMQSATVNYGAAYSMNVSFEVCEVGGDGDDCDGDSIGITGTCNTSTVSEGEWTNPQGSIDGYITFRVTSRRGT